MGYGAGSSMCGVFMCGGGAGIHNYMHGGGGGGSVW